LYHQKDTVKQIRSRMMQLDFSWENSVQQYIGVYQAALG